MAADLTGANTAHLGSVEVVTATKAFESRRSLLPTQHSPVTREQTWTKINNEAGYRVWDPAGPGWCKLTFTPNWSHSDLADNDTKFLIDSYYGAAVNGDTFLYYWRISATEGRWGFAVSATPSSWESYFTANTDDTRPLAGRAVRIACRWTSATTDEFDREGQSLDIYVNANDPTASTSAVVIDSPYNEDVICVTLGGVMELDEENLTGSVYSADGIITDLEIGSHPRTAIELKSRTGSIATYEYIEETQNLRVAGVASVSRIPTAYTFVASALGIRSAGIATTVAVPMIRTVTVVTEDVNLAGVAATSFVSA